MEYDFQLYALPSANASVYILVCADDNVTLVVMGTERLVSPVLSILSIMDA